MISQEAMDQETSNSQTMIWEMMNREMMNREMMDREIKDREIKNGRWGMGHDIPGGSGSGDIGQDDNKLRDEGKGDK